MTTEEAIIGLDAHLDAVRILFHGRMHALDPHDEYHDYPDVLEAGPVLDEYLSTPLRELLTAEQTAATKRIDQANEDIAYLMRTARDA